jgi:sec-independent protein translocase protein TatB
MFNLDPVKLLIIAVVAVMVLGPDKLPGVARQIGGAWRSFNDFRVRMETDMRRNIPDLPSTSDIVQLAKSPTALLSHLSNMSPETQSSQTRSDLAGVWDAVGQSTEEESNPLEPAQPGDAAALPRRRSTQSTPTSTQSTPTILSGDAGLN